MKENVEKIINMNTIKDEGCSQDEGRDIFIVAILKKEEMKEVVMCSTK